MEVSAPTPKQPACRQPAFTPFESGWVEQTLATRFETVVAAHRDCPALFDGERHLTYGQLDALTARIAAAIQERIGNGWEPVVLVLHQGLDAVAATLGILRAGKAYVPLDPADAPTRLADMADNVDARLFVTDRRNASLFDGLTGPDRGVLVVDDLSSGPERPNATELSPDSIAYIYFTSGSTGRPKGVVDNHRNVLHNVLRYTNALRIAPIDRLTVLQAPHFSGAVSSTFGALLNGATLFPFEFTGQRLPDLARMVRTDGITIYHSVPSIFRSMVAVSDEGFPQVRVVRLEGDRASSLDVELHRRHFAPDSILANGLGTTETGLCRQLRLSTTDPVSDGILPVGYAVQDTDVTILDLDGFALPSGSAGEIGVRSRYLSLGYWRRDDLTEAAFRPDPDDPQVRTYRTGDLGRLRPDGCLEYLGRRDAQFKVLGQRVEPAEVEAELLAMPDVAEAAVTTFEGRRSEGRLAAHVVLSDGGRNAAELRAALAERLPAHMVPSQIDLVTELPHSAIGKLDRRSLVPAAPSPGPATTPSELSGDQALLLKVWKRVLERDNIGLDDNFFEIGGDSLAAAELLVDLEAELGEELPPSLLLRAPTVALLAEAIRNPVLRADESPIVPLQEAGSGPPIVLIDPMDGVSNFYANLAGHLGTERPIWALVPPGGVLHSVDELAANHAAALIEADHDGPYLLAGYCFGGVMALEVASRLRAAGRDVPFVGLIGITVYDFPTLVAPEAAKRYHASRGLVPRLRRYLAQTRGLPLGQQVRHHLAGFLVPLRDLRRASEIREVRSRPEHAASWVVKRGAAMRDYAPTRLRGRAIAYLAEVDTARYSTDPERDWAGLAEDIQVHILPGRYDDLLDEPAVTDLATRIRADIDAALFGADHA